MLTLYQRAVSYMIEGVIAHTEKKKKLSQAWFWNIQGTSASAYTQDSSYVHSEPALSTRELKAGISGQGSTGLFCRLQRFLLT